MQKLYSVSPPLLLLLLFSFALFIISAEYGYTSAVGDPGMRRDGLRVAIEAWNQCNEVGEEVHGMGSPRAADCFDVHRHSSHGGKNGRIDKNTTYRLVHRITEQDNKLGVGDPFSGLHLGALNSVDLYAAEKELYLGSKCQVNDTPNPWQFWMIMLKSGNMDTYAAKCPKDGHRVGPYGPDYRFPCFGTGCMNQPLIFHNTTVLRNRTTLVGSFYGSWDLDANVKNGMEADKSYYAVTWRKNISKGSWVFHHVLKTSPKYTWLMLYLRSDATTGFSGGYHYQTRGMSKTIPESPNFKVRLTLKVIKGGGGRSQFYLMDMGSCWKNNGKDCDGDVRTDVTRYSEIIINPGIGAMCKPGSLRYCPPYHTFSNGTTVYRSDLRQFPYGAYHMYCSPGTGRHLRKPYNLCDPFSNPQPQEIMQILPHPVWGDYGYPTKRGQGWIGDPRTWELDVGRLSQSLYFYQDPGTQPARRRWMSIDIGTEVYQYRNSLVEWTVSDFDIIVPNQLN